MSIGKASGLVLAEVELTAPIRCSQLPMWVGADVTHEPRYRSSGDAQGPWRAGVDPRLVETAGYG